MSTLKSLYGNALKCIRREQEIVDSDDLSVPKRQRNEVSRPFERNAAVINEHRWATFDEPRLKGPLCGPLHSVCNIH